MIKKKIQNNILIEHFRCGNGQYIKIKHGVDVTVQPATDMAFISPKRSRSKKVQASTLWFFVHPAMRLFRSFIQAQIPESARDSTANKISAKFVLQTP